MELTLLTVGVLSLMTGLLTESLGQVEFTRLWYEFCDNYMQQRVVHQRFAKMMDRSNAFD